MTVLVDTHAFYWSLCAPADLGRQALLTLNDPGITKVLSVATFWEMTIKSSIGKLKLPKPIEFLWAEAEAAGIAVAGFKVGHFQRLSGLPRHHGDPFDRIMIAQALDEGWGVVSKDAEWDAYGVQRIW
jgi:PIN domain nuclease of toxin-antitoxin system